MARCKKAEKIFVDRKRRFYTDAQRKELRTYANEIRKANNGESADHKTLQKWWFSKYGSQIPQPVISKMLSDKYRYLDKNKTPLRPKQMKERPCRWPDLEAALFEWQQALQRQNITVNGDMLKSKALDYWNRLPQYYNEPTPHFSDGWLQNFKERHGIRAIRLHGEAASVDDSITVEQRMNEIRAVTDRYDLRDIYNMDETGLYWKLMPDKTLATEQLSGLKKDKSRVTIAVTANGDGTDRVPLWIIGTAIRPRCFKGIRIENLGCQWASNKEAWMNTVIMERWLRWFDGYVAAKQMDRRVLLLMDNFRPHENAVNNVRETGGLRHIETLFFPPNVTAKYQPADQGIISTFKAHYRKRFIQYLIREFDQKRDGRKTINILKAVRFAVDAWNLDVKDVTFFSCFLKSHVKTYGPHAFNGVHVAAQENVNQVVQTIQMDTTTLRTNGVIQEVMNIQRFLNPAEETVTDTMEDLDARILGSVQQGQDAESDEEVEELPAVTITDAITALEHLRLHELQQVDGDDEFLRQLERAAKRLEHRKRFQEANKHQTTLDQMWIK
jgi:hypothetical protein